MSSRIGKIYTRSLARNGANGNLNGPFVMLRGCPSFHYGRSLTDPRPHACPAPCHLSVHPFIHVRCWAASICAQSAGAPGFACLSPPFLTWFVYVKDESIATALPSLHTTVLFDCTQKYKVVYPCDYPRVFPLSSCLLYCTLTSRTCYRSPVELTHHLCYTFFITERDLYSPKDGYSTSLPKLKPKGVGGA